MHTPRIFVAYAPRAGLRCAVGYLAAGRDAFGWFTGPAEGIATSAYFLLEDYYTPTDTRCVLVAEDELHGGSIEPERCQALARLRDLMEHEWLFRRTDPDAAKEVDAYAAAELAMGAVGVRFLRLNRLSKTHAVWTYYSPAFEDGVLETLARHWALDYARESTGSLA